MIVVYSLAFVGGVCLLCSSAVLALAVWMAVQERLAGRRRRAEDAAIDAEIVALLERAR